MIGGGEFVPGELAKWRNTRLLRARILGIDDGEDGALRILEHGVTARAPHVARILEDGTASANRRFGSAIHVASSDVLQPVWGRLGRNFGCERHHASGGDITRLADRVVRVERPRLCLPVHHPRVESLRARYVAGQQLVPHETTAHIYLCHTALRCVDRGADHSPANPTLDYGTGVAWAGFLFG